MTKHEELIRATHQWLDTGGIHPAYAAVVRTLLAALESPPAAEEQEHCGLGSCAAMGGHEGTCAEASGWAVEGEPEREVLADEIFKHQPIISMRDGSLASCTCLDRVFINGKEAWDTHVADALIEEGYRREPEPREARTDYDDVIAEARNHVEHFAITEGDAIRVTRLADALESATEPREVTTEKYEYATTTGPRKSWDSGIDDPPDDAPGWELDPTRGRPGESWDRFDYHEERYWRRPVTPSTERGES